MVVGIKDTKKTKHNPIKEYTKRPDKVEAIQYKMHNKKDIKTFVGKSYSDNGTLYILTDKEELIVDYGDYVVKEYGSLVVYKESTFKDKYYY